MTLKNLLTQLEEIRETIAWNDVEDFDLTDKTKEKVIIDIDDIFNQISENEEQ